MRSDRPRAVIVGGSIGGLAAAVLLRDLGWEVDVYERSTEALRHRGAGIVVLPMTERYFLERGQGRRVSLRLTYWTYVDEKGRVLSATPDGYRFGSWTTIYRSYLEAFESDRYHLRSEMVDLILDDQQPGIVLRDGRRLHADLVVCADGVASTARAILLPDTHPVYAGYVAWRGTFPEERLSEKARELFRDAMVYQVLDHSHILVYAIHGSEPGSRLMNFVWYRNYPTGGPFEDLMTGVDGELRPSTVPPGLVRPEHLAEMRAAADVLAPPLREVVIGSTDVFIQAIFDLESPRMVFGRTILMGDAAFVARPHVAAGTAKACADAWALHEALRDAASLSDALAQWEPRQLALGRSVVERSRRMGTRSQFEGSMFPGDPEWKFGLFGPEVPG